MDMIPDNLRYEIWGLFDENRVIYLATDESGQPRVRPVTMVHLDEKFWVLTGMDEAKIEQIRSNPRIEACYLIENDENNGYVRFGGEAQVVSDQEVRTSIAKRVSYFKHYWQSPEDPKYALLELKFDGVEYMKPGEMIASKYDL